MLIVSHEDKKLRLPLAQMLPRLPKGVMEAQKARLAVRAVDILEVELKKRATLSLGRKRDGEGQRRAVLDVVTKKAKYATWSAIFLLISNEISKALHLSEQEQMLTGMRRCVPVPYLSSFVMVTP
jgi:hypothetical protein